MTEASVNLNNGGSMHEGTETVLEPTTTAHPLTPVFTRVVRVRRETKDTWTIWIERPDVYPGHRPGQFNMLYVPGVGEVPISIASSQRESAARIAHTIRRVGPVTSALVALRKGDYVGIRGPYGSHWPVGSAAGHDVVVIAGGLGLAPLRPAVVELLKLRRKLGALALLYGARTPEDLLYQRELAKWRQVLDFQLLVTVDRGTRDWHGHVGVVTTLIPGISFDPSRTIAFICGPEIMMRFAVRELLSRGVPPNQVYVSLERNLQCAVGFCGHCQLGPKFICADGPVFPYDVIEPYFLVKQL